MVTFTLTVQSAWHPHNGSNGIYHMGHKLTSTVGSHQLQSNWYQQLGHITVTVKLISTVGSHYSYSQIDINSWVTPQLQSNWYQQLGHTTVTVKLTSTVGSHHSYNQIDIKSWVTLLSLSNWHQQLCHTTVTAILTSTALRSDGLHYKTQSHWSKMVNLTGLESI